MTITNNDSVIFNLITEILNNIYYCNGTLMSDLHNTISNKSSDNDDDIAINYMSNRLLKLVKTMDTYRKYYNEEITTDIIDELVDELETAKSIYYKEQYNKQKETNEIY